MARRKTENGSSGGDNHGVLTILSETDWAALIGKDDPGQTVNEIVEQTGRSPRSIHRWLATEIAAGRVIKGSRDIVCRNGGHQRVPVYRQTK